MKQFVKRVAVVALFLLISACATTGLYYLGFHGPTIKQSSEVHEGIWKDQECLECHGPNANDSDASPTTHPQFVGCLKCHNDEIKPID